MTPINASTVSPLVDEAFSIASLTDAAFNRNYTFEGFRTVNVASYTAVPLSDYGTDPAHRFGAVQDPNGTLQPLTMTQQKSFNIAVDKFAESDSAGTLTVAGVIARQMSQEVIPTIDQYRLNALANGAGTIEDGSAATADNAYDLFLDAQAALTDAKVPLTGRIAFMSTAFYGLLKKGDKVILASELGQEMKINGVVGVVDGVNIIVAPTSYLPENTNFIMTHNTAAIAPVKIHEIRVLEQHPDVAGAVVQGAFYYDAFVLANKANAVYLSQNPAR